jgi:hypothetical protein
MPNSTKMNNRNTTTLASAGNEDNNDPISLRMLGTALIDLRGRRTLKVLNAFKFGIEGMNSMILG